MGRVMVDRYRRRRQRRKVYDRGGARDTLDPSARERRHVALVCVTCSFCQKDPTHSFRTGSGCREGPRRLPLCALVGPFMPTPTSTTGPDEIITSPDALTTYFRAASKPRAQWRVGVEQEKVGVYADGSP